MRNLKFIATAAVIFIIISHLNQVRQSQDG